jgi:hypothetical protein
MYIYTHKVFGGRLGLKQLPKAKQGGDMARGSGSRKGPNPSGLEPYANYLGGLCCRSWTALGPYVGGLGPKTAKNMTTLNV